MNKEVLKQIIANDDNGQPSYVTAADGQPLAKAGFIEVNIEVKDPNDASKVLARSTQKGRDAVSENTNTGHQASTSHAMIVTGAVLPAAKKRGNSSGSGAPTKYPFADLEVGGMFFSPNSDHAKGDAVKALGSTVSAQNDKYSEETGEYRTVTRAVRDKQTKKAKLDAQGNKEMETVQLPVKRYNRKFTIRPVEGGKAYGSWTAPEDGALVARTV